MFRQLKGLRNAARTVKSRSGVRHFVPVVAAAAILAPMAFTAAPASADGRMHDPVFVHVGTVFPLSAVVNSGTTVTVTGSVRGWYGHGSPEGTVNLNVQRDGTSYTVPCTVAPLGDPSRPGFWGDSRDYSSDFSCTFNSNVLAPAYPNQTPGTYTFNADFNPDPNRWSSDANDPDDYDWGQSNGVPFQLITPTPTPTPTTLTPGTVTNVVASAVNPVIPANTTGSANVTWDALNTSGVTVTGYTVTSAPGGFTCSTTTATTCVVSGLSPNVPYTFSVVAATSAGASGVGVSNSVTITTVAQKKPNRLVLVVANFGIGSSTLTPYMKLQIQAFARDVWNFGGTSATLTGYADPTGSAANNVVLGLHRAQAVQAYLASELQLLGIAGVPSPTLTSMGSKAPVANNNTALGRALNRRVRVVVNI